MVLIVPGTSLPTPAVSTPNRKKNRFLDSLHPAYEKQKAEWEMNELRAMGSTEILKELIPFDWEQDHAPNSHYAMRQSSAVYLNFPDRFSSLMVGHMMQKAPTTETTLNFGTLGEVRRRRDIDEPTPAELLYYNADGNGADGSQWNSYWTHVTKAAIHCGMRWVLVEGPRIAPGNRQNEIDGLRPILVDYSPLQVTNWHYEGGRLVMAIIQRWTRDIVIGRGGEVEGNSGARETMLLTADGFDGFGQDYRKGGFYIFQEDGSLKRFGFYDDTDGEIPMVAMYYERLRGNVISSAICRSGVTELGNAAVAYMNLASAADFDAWDSATSAQALIGVDEASFNLFVTKRNEGNRFAPLPAAQDDNARLPQIQDTSTGAVVADVFDKRLKAKREEATELMLNEIEAAPYASGESKQISFKDGKAPRLAVLASEIETAQNSIIHFCEKMWGTGRRRTTGSVEWPREFNLQDFVTAAKDFFEIEVLAGMRSPTADKRMMAAVTRSLGIVGDTEDRATVEEEYGRAADKARDKQELEAEPPPKPGTNASRST